jgi:hypothetical protein
MKIRIGFVSNSSSSSFVVVLKKDAEGQNTDIFKYVLELAALVKTQIKNRPVGDYRDELEKELKLLKKDAAFQAKRVEVLKKYAEDKKFCEKMKLLDEELSLISDNIHWTVRDSIRSRRDSKKYESQDEWYKARNVVSTALDRSTSALKSLEGKIPDIEAKLKALVSLTDDQIVYSFEEDYGSSSGIKQAVLKMVEDEKVVVVERINS